MVYCWKTRWLILFLHGPAPNAYRACHSLSRCPIFFPSVVTKFKQSSRESSDMVQRKVFQKQFQCKRCQAADEDVQYIYLNDDTSEQKKHESKM